jgi:hypothetical protein
MPKGSETFTVKKGVTVVRDGKRVKPEIGKTFPFTAEEVENIRSADPAALMKPAGEEEGTATAAATSTTSSSAEGSQAGAKDGEKTPTANKSDAEAKEAAKPAKGKAAAATDDDL